MRRRVRVPRVTHKEIEMCELSFASVSLLLPPIKELARTSFGCVNEGLRRSQLMKPH